MQTFLAVLDEMLTNPTVGGLDAAGQPLGDWVPVAAGQSLEKLKVGAPPSQPPGAAPACRADSQRVQELFLNFHHLLNSHRPQQARAELLRMLQEQRQRRSDAREALDGEVAALEQTLADAIRKLKGAGLRDIEQLCAVAAAPPAAAAAAAQSPAAQSPAPASDGGAAERSAKRGRSGGEAGAGAAPDPLPGERLRQYLRAE